MSGYGENPAFISDEGKGSNGSTQEGTTKTEKHAMVEMNNLKKNEDATGEYDPYLNRQVEHPTTNAETLLHLLKGSLGTGILAMPKAFDQAGYLLGIICTIIIGFICTYCVHMIIKAEYVLCKRRKIPSLSYPATAEAAFEDGPPVFRKLAPYAPIIVNVFLLIYQLGACCVYTVFISDNIKAVADEYVELDLEIWMLITLLPLVLINYIRNLKFLAPFSTVANFITIASFGIILYYLVNADITFENRKVTGAAADFPLYFGTVLFALEAIGVIMPLENEMKTPKAFGGLIGVLNIAMVSIVVLYVAMGFVGYLAYGAGAADSITLNLNPEEIPAQVAKILLACAIFVSHPLQMYVAIDIVWTQYLSSRFEKNNFKLLIEYAVRTLLVLITFGLAIAIPRLGLFISLFGALCLSALGLAFPAFIEISTFWNTFEGTKGRLALTKNYCIIAFSVVGLVAGTYTSLKEIVESFS